MSFTFVAVLLAALTLYSYVFIRRSGFVQQTVLLPFLHKIHIPAILSTLTPDEHEGLHHQIDIFNVRILSCFVAAVVATGVSFLFLILAANGGADGVSGFILAVGFAYVCANYDLNNKMIRWVHLSENELLGRVLQKNVDNSEYNSLSEYLKAEQQKLLQTWIDEIKLVGEEFDKRLKELGYDQNRDYMESPETEQELVDMLEQVTAEINQKHIEPREK